MADHQRYTVKTGDTLDSIAKEHGLTWQQLAKFNWGTTNPRKINRALRVLVGCTKKTRQGNYIFDSADAPGVLRIPKRDMKPGPATVRKQAMGTHHAKGHAQIELQAVNGMGHRLQRVVLQLRHEETGEVLSVTTDDKGYALLRDVPPGHYRVLTPWGRPAYYQRKLGDAPQNGLVEAVVDVSNRSAAITHVVVGSLEDLKETPEREVLRKLYSRASVPSTPTGQEEETYESPRGAKHWCADNLAIAAGWTKGFKSVDTHRLVSKVLPGWLKDYHPTALVRGYYVLVLEPMAQRLTLVSSSGVATHHFKLKPGVELHGLVGVYAMFEDLQDDRFVDMASLRYGITLPAHVTQGMSLFELVTTPELLEKALNAHVGQVQLVYFLPPPAELAQMAIHGGTGRLEDHGADPALNSSIHQRNVVVCQSIARAYEAYVATYVKRVKAAKSEQEIRALGPPLSIYQMPSPVAATDDQRVELFKASGKVSLEPWLAIAHQLDALYNRKAQGYPFVRFKLKYRKDVGAETEKLTKKQFPKDDVAKLSDKVTPELEVELQMDLQVVDGDMQVITKGDVLQRVTLKPGGFFKGRSSNGFPLEISYKQSHGMKDKQVVTIKLGKFQIERDSVGKTKLSLDALPGVAAESEFNDRTGEFGGAFTLKGKDLAKVLRARAGELAADSQESTRMQRWANWLESFELQLLAGFVGTREETILSVIAQGPGLFERRSLQDLFHPKTQWNELTLDEQLNLSTLGWEQDNWDRKFLKDAQLPKSVGKMRAELSKAERTAIVRLGFFAYEDYRSMFQEKRSEFSNYTF